MSFDSASHGARAKHTVISLANEEFHHHWTNFDEMTEHSETRHFRRNHPFANLTLHRKG